LIGETITDRAPGAEPSFSWISSAEKGDDIVVIEGRLVGLGSDGQDVFGPLFEKHHQRLVGGQRIAYRSGDSAQNLIPLVGASTVADAVVEPRQRVQPIRAVQGARGRVSH
jgi:hypothetical protein